MQFSVRHHFGRCSKMQRRPFLVAPVPCLTDFFQEFNICLHLALLGCMLVAIERLTALLSQGRVSYL